MAGLDLLALLAFFPSVISSIFAQNKGGPDPPLDPPLGTPYNGLCGKALPERGTFFKLQVYKRVVFSQAEVENIFLLLLNPPSNNIELQKIIAKHVHECYEIRKKNVGNSQL